MAIGRSLIDPRELEKPVALTVFPSTKECTCACRPAQLVSVHESNPSLVPSKYSSLESLGCQKLIMEIKECDLMIENLTGEIKMFCFISLVVSVNQLKNVNIYTYNNWHNHQFRGFPFLSNTCPVYCCPLIDTIPTEDASEELGRAVERDPERPKLVPAEEVSVRLIAAFGGGGN